MDIYISFFLSYCGSANRFIFFEPKNIANPSAKPTHVALNTESKLYYCTSKNASAINVKLAYLEKNLTESIWYFKQFIRKKSVQSSSAHIRLSAKKNLFKFTDTTHSTPARTKWHPEKIRRWCVELKSHKQSWSKYTMRSELWKTD